MRCEVCKLKVVVATCCRPLCHHHVFDPESHAPLCPDAGICEVCRAWTHRLSDCPDCARAVCQSCSEVPGWRIPA